MPAQKEISVSLYPPKIEVLADLVKKNRAVQMTPIAAYKGLQKWQQNVKRLMDVIISVTALVILLPLIIYTAIRTALTGKGKIIYSQERIGYKGRPFIIYKFRSMEPDAEKNGPMLSSEHDARITKWGKVMRRWRLDELPQLWNILKGDMSLVGPRPERRFYIDAITKTHPQYQILFKVKPGLTSWGMVKFGYAENVRQMTERLQYDMEYMQNISLKQDFKIMIHTVKIIVSRKGK